MSEESTGSCTGGEGTALITEAFPGEDLGNILGRLTAVVEATQLLAKSEVAVQQACEAVELAKLTLTVTGLQLVAAGAPTESLSEVEQLAVIFAECHARLVEFFFGGGDVAG
jgi:hypothetical protein